VLFDGSASRRDKEAHFEKAVQLLTETGLRRTADGGLDASWADKERLTKRLLQRLHELGVEGKSRSNNRIIRSVSF
jgi:hypothetical protein